MIVAGGCRNDGTPTARNGAAEADRESRGRARRAFGEGRRDSRDRNGTGRHCAGPEEIRATAIVKPNEYRLAHVSPRIPGKAVEVRALLGDVGRAGAGALRTRQSGARREEGRISAGADEPRGRPAQLRARGAALQEADLFGEGVPGGQGRVRAQRRRVSGSARGACGSLGSRTARSHRSSGAAKAQPLSHFPLRGARSPARSSSST